MTWNRYYFRYPEKRQLFILVITIMVIMNRYTKMYGWLNSTFGNTMFTIDDFRMNFPSPQPTKTIYDLIKLDFIRRMKRGKYKVVKPEEFVQRIVKENLENRNVLEKAERKYTYSDSTAVNIWTNGYYWTDFTKGFKPVHIKVLKKDLKYWDLFFKSNDAEFTLENENKALFGLTYVLHPVDSMKVEKKDDSPVMPLKETVNLCREKVYLYKPALEYLDKKYGLNLLKSYEQVLS